MDTLNSFGDQNCYWADIALELEVPAKDIFYCSQLIADRPFHSKTVESGEWIVINRSPTGVVHIPVSSIRIRSGKHRYETIEQSRSRIIYKRFLSY
ncbi:hypothetical protein [Providencia hangzhouensis]|uniref:hypothetical protein n=1 Tax=Providencia hangzhouensis TaxID=3031799 RepID=UPI0034DD59E0